MVRLMVAVICLLAMLGVESGAEILPHHYASSEEGLNLKEFNSGESFYLWTTSSVKVA